MVTTLTISLIVVKQYKIIYKEGNFYCYPIPARL